MTTDQRHQIKRDDKGRVIVFWTQEKYGGNKRWVKWEVSYRGESREPLALTRKNRAVTDGMEAIEVFEFTGSGVSLQYQIFAEAKKGEGVFDLYGGTTYSRVKTGSDAGKYLVEKWIIEPKKTEAYLSKAEVIQENWHLFKPGKVTLEKLNSEGDEGDEGDNPSVQTHEREPASRKERSRPSSWEIQKPLPGLEDENGDYGERYRAR